MNVYKWIKQFFKQILEKINYKIDLMNQKEAERLQALEENNRKEMERNFGIYLRKRWALVLNSLPDFMRIFSGNIDYNFLVNKLLGSYWEIYVPIPNKISNTKCKTLKDSMKEILQNQSRECYQEFESRFHCDANEYEYQMYLFETGGTRTIDDSVFLLNYMRFYEDHCFKLIDITIIDINCTEERLYIKYKVDTSSCISWNCNNYAKLIFR